MAIRVVNGILHIRFQKFKIEISKTTGLRDTEKNREKAKRIEFQERDRLTDRIRLGQSPIVQQTFKRCADDLLVWVTQKHQDAPSTIEGYRFAIRRLIVFFGPMILQEIHTTHVHEYISSYLSHLKASSLRSHLNFLSAVFEHGKRRHWCEHNPVREMTKTLPSMRGCGRHDVVISEEEEDRYFACAAHPILADFSMLQLLTGFRTGELLNLKTEDIDFEQKLIHVCRKHSGHQLVRKTESAERTLPLTDGMEEILRRRTAGNPRWIFCGYRYPMRRLNADVLCAWHRRTLASAGLRYFPLYAFRHTFATRNIQEGTPISTLQKWLGHASITMTQKYVHVTPEHEHTAMAKYAKSISEKSKHRQSRIPR